MQAVVVALTVFEQERRRAFLAGAMTFQQELREMVGITTVDAETLVPGVGDGCKMPVELAAQLIEIFARMSPLDSSEALPSVSPAVSAQVIPLFAEARP